MTMFGNIVLCFYVTKIILCLITIYPTNAINSNYGNTHVVFNITRTLHGDKFSANVPLICHSFRSSCSGRRTLPDLNCYECSCMGSNSFFYSGISYSVFGGLNPGGICSDRITCGSGFEKLYLKSTLVKQGLKAYNISHNVIDYIVGGRRDYFHAPCTLVSAVVLLGSTKKLVSPHFVIRAEKEGKNFYELTLEWNISIRARQYYAGRMIIITADCGIGQTQCFNAKFAGTEHYEKSLPTTSPPTTVTTMYQSTSNSSKVVTTNTTSPSNSSYTPSTTAPITRVTNHTEATLAASTMSSSTSSGNTTNSSTLHSTTVAVTTEQASSTTKSTGKPSTTISVLTTEASSTESDKTTHGTANVTSTPVPGTYKQGKSGGSGWVIILCGCLIILIISGAVVLGGWVYWKRKKRYCYDGAPIFTRLERSSVDSQRPDFLNPGENHGFADLKTANDNAGVDHIETDSREELVNPGYHEMEAAGDYQDFYTAVRDRLNIAAAAADPSRLANNNEYDSPVPHEGIELSKSSGESESTNAESLEPSQGYQYQSLHPSTEPNDGYTSLVKEPRSESHSRIV